MSLVRSQFVFGFDFHSAQLTFDGGARAHTHTHTECIPLESSLVEYGMLSLYACVVEYGIIYPAVCRTLFAITVIVCFCVCALILCASFILHSVPLNMCFAFAVHMRGTNDTRHRHFHHSDLLRTELLRF